MFANVFYAKIYLKSQWGSENQQFQNWNHLKTGHFGGRFLNGSDFEWSGA